MALDLGTLFATLDIKDDGWSSKITKAKTDLQDLARTAETAGKIDLDVTPKGADKVDQARKSAEDLGRELNSAARTKPDVTPKGTGALDKASDSAEDLGRSLERAGKSKPDVTPKGTGSVTAAANSARKLTDDLNAAGRAKPDVTPRGAGQLDKAASSAKNLGANLNGAAGSGRGLSVSTQPATELDKAAGAGGRLRGALDSLGELGGLIGVGAAAGGVTAGLAAAMKVGNEFTNEMNTMQAVSGGTAAQMQEVSAKARELGNAIDLPNTSASDAAAAMTELAKGGFTVEQSMTAAKGTLQLAAAAGTDAASAATIQSQALQSFGLQADYAAKMSDVLANAANQSSAEIGDIAAGLQQSGAVANQFGLSVEDTAASLSLLANAGIQGSDAGTLLKSTLLAVTDQGKPAQAAIEELGLTIYDANGQFVGMSSLMEQLQDASEGMTDEQYQAATATLFGSDAMRLAGVAAEVGGEGFDKMRKAMDDQGAAADVAAAKTQGLPGAIGQVGNAAEALGQSLYDRFQGPLTTALEAAAGGITNLADAMGSVPGPALAGTLGLVAAKFLDLNGKMGSVTGGLSTFAGGVRAAKADAVDAGSRIGTMSAAIQVLGQKSSTIANMSQAFQSASTPLRIMGMDAREAASQTTGLGKAAQNVKGGLSTFGGVLSGTVAGGFSLAKSGAKGLMTALGGPWGLAIGGATAVIGQLIAKHQEAKAAEEQHKAMQDSLRESLEQTTGAITAQTEELVMKSLQDAGVTDIARDFGVAQDTLRDAATGSAEALSTVNSAIDAQMSASFKGSEFWGKYSTDLEAAGISMQDLVNHAMNPASQAAGDLNKKLNDMAEGDDKFQHIRRDLDRAQDGFKGTTGEARKFRDELGGISDDTSTAQLEQMADSLDRFADGSNKAGAAMKLLNGEKMHLSDPEHLVVDMDPEKAAQVKSELEEIGLKAEYSSETRQLTIEFPNSGALAAALQELQGQIVTLPDGTIDVQAMTAEAQQDLVDLGLAAEIDGEVRMKDNIQSQIQRLVELGALAIVDGQLTLGDNIQVVDGKLVALDGTQIGANLTVGDNVPKVKSNVDSLNGRNTSSTHTIWVQENLSRGVTYEQAVQLANVRQGFANARAANASGGRLPRNAAGDRIPRNATGDKNPGYRLPTTGPGTGVVDGILGINGDGLPMSWVDAGEWIINRRSSDRWDGTLAAINQGNPSAVVAAMLADLEHHANGGKTGSQRVKEQLGPYNNGQYVMGGFSPDATDCSGAVSMGVNSYLGRDPFESRMSTVTEGQWLAERGFKEGRGDGNDLVVGWYDYGGGANGHTAMQLPDGTYIESGGNTGQGLTIGGAAGPLDGRGFTNFMYLPADEAKEREEGGLTGDLGASSDTGTGEYQSEASSAAGYSAYSSSATSTATPTMPETTVNGGNGTLIKDGSALELAAAAFSTTTGTPMPDNVVSWGQVMGTTTTRDQEETEAAIKQNEREKRANDRNIAATERELEAARQDAADKQAIYDAAAAGKGEAQAQKDLDEARRKQAEAQRELDEAEADDKESKQKALDSATEDVRKKEKALRAVADGKEAAAAKRDLDDANAKIADLEDQLAVQRENSQAYEDANNELRRSNLTPTSHRLEGTGPFGMVTDADRAATQDQITQNERELEANERNIQATQRELDAANQDVSDKEADVNNAGTDEERKEAERNLAEAKDKVGELTSKLEGQRATSEQLRQSNQNLANSVDRLSLAMVASSVIDGVSSLAGGAMNLIPMADGGVLGAARNAQINDSSAVLWAEAGPEAYIPLSSSKRARSVDIWAETGKRLGIDAISAVQLLGSGIPGLMEGRTDGFSTGGSISLDAMGLNTDAAAYMIGNAIASPVTAARTAAGGQNVTGAVFNGPVTISDPRAWVQGQANNAGKMLDTAMKGVMLR